MHQPIQEILELAEKCDHITMTASGIITQQPGYIFDIHLAAYAGDVAECELHKGTKENTIPDYYLYTIASTSFNYSWWPPIFSEQGFYFVASGNLKGCSFQFLRKEP